MSPWTPFQPPEDGLSPQEVRFLEIRAEPWPDGRRVKVHLRITPFLERPNVEAIITGPNDQEVASISIIESIDDEMSFTMHLRGTEISGSYTLTASLSYPETGVVSQDRVVFETSEKTE